MKARLLNAFNNALVDALNISVSGISTQQICIAYSGGLDSTVLLHIAKLYCQNNDTIELSAFHVNHGLSDFATQWQTHCANQCDILNIPFHTIKLSLSKVPQESLEAIARDARYAALDKYALDNKLVMLGQHQDDQAETMLLQLKRGSGVRGLASMAKVHKRSSGLIYVRPFLAITRQQLQQFADQEKLSWIEDDSNQDISFDRNFLRNKVLPSLNQRWPSFNSTVARSAENCAQADIVINEYMEYLWQSLEVSNTQLSIAKLSAVSVPTQAMLLRYWLSVTHKLTLSKIQLEMLMKLLLNKQKNAVHLRFGKVALEKYGDVLHLLNLNNAQSVNQTEQSQLLDWQTNHKYELNECYCIELVNNADSQQQCNEDCLFYIPKAGVNVSFGGSNLRFKLQVNRPSKKLKVWYQEWQVSPLIRQQTPILHIADEAILVGLPSAKINTKCVTRYTDIHNADLIDSDIIKTHVLVSLKKLSFTT